jgi:FtsH-binding integral membrane protein
MSPQASRLYWAMVATGCVGICAGGLLAFSLAGIVALFAAAGILLAACVVGAFRDRTLGAAVMPFTMGLAVLLLFPLIVNAAFWVGRGFEGPDGGGTTVQPPGH